MKQSNIDLSELTAEEKKDKFDEFLKERGIKVFWALTGYRKYFPEDMKERDIYTFTVSKNWESERFKFWDSLNNTELRMKKSELFERPGSIDFFYWCYFWGDYEEFILTFWEESAIFFTKQNRYNEKLERVLWKPLCQDINLFINDLQY